MTVMPMHTGWRAVLALVVVMAQIRNIKGPGRIGLVFITKYPHSPLGNISLSSSTSFLDESSLFNPDGTNTTTP